MQYISIVVPMYKGNRYIEDIIRQIEAAQENILQDYKLELIFVNDYPNEPLKIYTSKKILLSYIDNNVNIGIHASRIRGLESSKGEYILFLDQDDTIERDFFQKQLDFLCGFDAVVCNGINRGIKIYEHIEEQKRAINIHDYKCGVNRIISPGQVLIRTEAIPRVWREKNVTKNGADDYFLWFLMLLENKKFNINPEVLYTHSIHGNNASHDSGKMLESVTEIVQFLIEEKYLTKEEEKNLQEILSRRPVPKTDREKKYFSYTKLLSDWMLLLETDKNIEEYFVKKGFFKVAIYGMGILGKHMERQLRETTVEVRYIIDRNKGLSKNGIPCVKVGEKLDMIDVIIVTPIDEFYEISGRLKENYSVPIVSLENIIYAMLE